MSKAGHTYFTNMNPQLHKIIFSTFLRWECQDSANCKRVLYKRQSSQCLPHPPAHCPKVGPLLGTYSRLQNGKECSSPCCLSVWKEHVVVHKLVCAGKKLQLKQAFKIEGASVTTEVKSRLKFKWDIHCTALGKVSDGLWAEDSCHSQDAMAMCVNFQEICYWSGFTLLTWQGHVYNSLKKYYICFQSQPFKLIHN